jgi:hypothetical protein
MVAWWEWIAWMATVCVAVRLGSVVAGWHERGRLTVVPVRVRARHDAPGR